MIVDSAIVIGNGESRCSIDTQKLTGRIILIGCNAIHRDAIVNHLICVDNRMVEEAVANINTSETNIYVRPSSYNLFHTVQKRKNILLVPPIPNQSTDRIDQPRNWGSGSFALLIGAQLPNVNKIYLIGFDLYGIKSFVNNLYKNTKNYSDERSHAINPDYWIRQSLKIFKLYPDKEFVIVNYSDWKIPDQWRLENVKVKLIEDFKTEFAI
jgi:hypothetical protein